MCDEKCCSVKKEEEADNNLRVAFPFDSRYESTFLFLEEIKCCGLKMCDFSLFSTRARERGQERRRETVEVSKNSLL